VRRLLLISLLAIGCRSYKDDIEAICSAEDYLEDDQKPLFKESPYAKKGPMLLAAVEKKVKTAEGKKFLVELAAATNPVRVNMLRTDSSKNGLEKCALSDFFEKAPKSGPSLPEEPTGAPSTSAPLEPPKKETAKLTVGETTVTGKLAVEPIKGVIRANFAKLRACHAEALKRDGSTYGTTTVKLAITAKGTIENAAATGGTIKDAAMRKCVVAAYQSITFPLPESGKAQVISTVDYQPAF
jgi:hypothetical protein